MNQRERVLALLPSDADGVILDSPGTVSWYLGGARTTVPLGGASVIAVRVGRDADEVRCHVMEAERLSAEEGVANLVAVEWTEPLVPDDWLLNPRLRTEQQLEAQLRAARASLTELEADRYRTLGAELAAAVTAVAAQTTPYDAERSVAGDLADQVYSLGAEPVVLLVAGADRLAYRHPLVTEKPLGERAMLVVGAKRNGLIANLTRWVQFGGNEPSNAAGIRAVEADVLDATVPGAGIADVFSTLLASYMASGFDADEWRRHHQGGPTGYVGRDPKVTQHTSGVVAERQAFAWNPSAFSAKAEDTVLTTSAGIELLTHDPAWPAIDVAGRMRPLTLQP